MKELFARDAVTLRRQIGVRDISPVELVESCISRIHETNPRVNAVVTQDFDRARIEARKAEAAVLAGEALGPLHGLPFLVKDLADTEGLRTTYGSLCFADHVPDCDSSIVARMRAAGGILLGKTNTPEFGAGANTSNAVFGSTCNPFDTKATCGGSSGGSAVALAFGMAPLATGSDLGGSLRIPASFCGVVGMRPSSGLVPSRGHVLGFSPLWTDGPMARNVADCALMLSVIAGYDRDDPMSFPIDDRLVGCLERQVDLSTLRVGFSTDLGVAQIDEEIRALFESRKAEIGRHFRETSCLDLDLASAAPTFRALRAESLYASFGQLVKRENSKVGRNVVSNVLEAEMHDLRDLAQAGAEQTRLFQGLFDDIDVLICPATAVSPFPLEMNHPPSINGTAIKDYFDWYAIT